MTFAKTLLIPLAAALALAGCSKHSQPENEIKIGLITELTGSVPAIGASSKNGATLAVDDINAQGGIAINGKKMPVKLLVEDNGDTADQSVAIAQKLISNDHVLAFVGPNASLGAVPASEIAEGSKMLMITPWSTDVKATLDTRTGKSKHWVFRACFTDPFEAQVLAKFARTTLKAKTAAILYDVGSEAPVQQSATFLDAFEKAGEKVVAFETYSSGDKDFSAQLTKIKAANPDVLYFPSYYSDVPLIAQQARRLGITSIFLGSDAWSSPQLIPLSHGAVEGSYFANHYSPDATNPVTQHFVQAYEKKFGSKPDDIAALTYDAFQVLFRAIAKAGKIDTTAVRDAMSEIPAYDGVTGTIKYSATSGDPSKSVAVMKINHDQFTWIENAAP